MIFNKDVDKKIERNARIIDAKLKDSFKAIKKDMAEIKDVSRENKDFIVSLEEKLSEIKQDICKNKEVIADSSKELELQKQAEFFKFQIEKEKEKQELNLLIEKQKFELEIQKEKLKQEVQKERVKSDSKIFNFQKQFRERVELKRVEKAYEKQLNEISKKYQENQKELIKQAEKSNSLIKSIENQRKKDFEKFMKEKDSLVEIYELKLRSLEENNKSFQESLVLKIDSMTKKFSDIIKESNKNFERTLVKLEKKRQEDNLIILRQLAIKEKEKPVDIDKVKKIEVEENLFDKIKGKFASFNEIGKKGVVSKDSLFWKVLPYVFLIILGLLAVNQYFKWEIVNAWNWQIVVLGILTGGLTFWNNRDKIEKEMDDEKNKEELQEEIRKKEFGFKFPRINKIWGVRNIVKWMYKEGWWYSITAVILIIVGFSIRLYHLGRLSLWWDELITGMYVSRILETGLPLFPSGLGYYWRGVAYNYFVSIFTFLFGNTEFWLRFPSVLFGMGIVILSFIFAKKINKTSGLLVLLFLTFSTYNIEYSQFARFYVMNAFLFMLALLFVYKGLFLKQKKYLWLSMIIFILMVHTVQLGSFYVFIIGTYIFYSLIFILLNKNENCEKSSNLSTYLFIFVSILIAGIGNFFARFVWLINQIKGKEIYAYQLLENISAPAIYPLLKWPQWQLFSFFNQNYIPFIFFLVAIILGIFVVLKDIKSKQTLSWFGYLLLSTLFTIIGYEFINRNVTGARIFFFMEGLYIILIISSLVILLKFLFKKLSFYKLLSLLLVMLLFFSITPYFYNQISLNYGDSVLDNPFRSTHVSAYRADYKTTYDYLKNNIQEGDIWIAVITTNYQEYGISPDYILNQNYRWNTLSFVNGSNFISPKYNSILINKAKDIEEIISNNKDKQVWLVVNGGSVNIAGTTHIRKDFINFLENNTKNVIYNSSDGYSEVYLFNSNSSLLQSS